MEDKKKNEKEFKMKKTKIVSPVSSNPT